MLVVKNLTLGFGSKTLVKDVSFTVEPGTVTGLVAPNGHGKTTLLRALAGMGSGHARGAVRVDRIAPRDGAALRRAVFYAPGDATLLYPSLTAAEHLRMVSRLWASPLSRDEVARACGIDAFAHKRVRALSQGMKQQLTLAMAYLTGTRYLLLDEPMNALDPTNVQLHSRILRMLARRGRGIVLSSHILDNVDQISDEVLFIYNQGIVSGDVISGERAADRYRRLYSTGE